MSKHMTEHFDYKGDTLVITHWFRFREIKVSNPYPPIPIRTHDWCAHFDDDGEEAGKYGYGATQQEAIDDLIENYG